MILLFKKWARKDTTSTLYAQHVTRYRPLP